MQFFADSDGLETVLSSIEPIDPASREAAHNHIAELAIPPRALGRLHDISEQICGITRSLTPDISRKHLLVMAGDHGVTAEGVSAFPQSITGLMVATFIREKAGINAMARHSGVGLTVVDMGCVDDFTELAASAPNRIKICKVGPQTKNMFREPAMTRDQAVQCIMTGFNLAAEQVEKGAGLLGTGDMGIGNTTPSAAIGAVVTGCGPDTMVGPGTGVAGAALDRKREIVSGAIEVNRPDRKDGLDVLSKVGGFEIGGIAGVVLAAAHHKKPVVIDGFISTAGALIAALLAPNSVDYMIAGHASEEPGHAAMLEHLGLLPVLQLGMRLGEGSGAALAMSIIDAALRSFHEISTFADAGIS